jgi:hypothetical protein
MRQYFARRVGDIEARHAQAAGGGNLSDPAPIMPAPTTAMF